VCEEKKGADDVWSGLLPGRTNPPHGGILGGLMVKNKGAILAILISFQMSVTGAAAADLRTVESVTLGDGPIELVAKLEDSQAGVGCPNASSWRWGSEQVCPRRRVASLDVAFEGRPVFIPYSAFADLGNPTSIQVESSAKSTLYSIKIVGGNAGTSYSAVLKFKSGLLLEKMVLHGEFPADAWEKTIYKFNFAQ
jgi:hypothetical protein